MMTSEEEYHGQHKREAYQLAIGKIIWAWTEYHEMLAELYAHLHEKEKWSESLADWHSEKDDHRARAKLLRVAKEKLAVGSRGLDAITWIVKATDQVLRDNRNIAAHMPLMSYTDEHGKHEILPMTLLGNPRAIQMARRDVLTNYQLLELRINLIKNYAIMIDLKLRERPDHPQEWPERPRL
jgi:hypothetical protein